jgi:hydrogenase maturation protease
MKAKKHTLILGIGNEILTDDGIGPKLVMQMQSELFNQDAEFSTAFVGGLDILEIIRDYRQVIFVDAMKTRTGIPGEVYFFTPENFRETMHLSSFHDVSFLTAIELGKELKLTIPDDIHIIAIEIIEDLTFSKNFSPEIEEKFDDIYDSVRNKVLQLMNSSTNTL